MKNMHIAFISSPIASHINPLLPVVATLRRRGHRVTFATGSPFVARVQPLGAEIIEYSSGHVTAQSLDETTFCRIAINALGAVNHYYGKQRPDLLVYDLVAFAGWILEHAWGVAAIKTSPHFAFSKDYFEEQVPDPAYRSALLSKSALASRFLQQHSVPVDDFLLHRGSLEFHLSPREFEPCPAAVDERCFHVGRCSGEQIAFGSWPARHDDDRPLVLVATSKSYVQGADYFKLCIAAFEGLGWRVVLSIDDDADVSALGALPDGFEVVQKTSHTRILPYASLLVYTGGITAASEAAYHGVPLLVTSLGIRELEWVASAIMRLGTGAHIKGKELTAAAMRAAALQILGSPTVRANVEQLRDRTRRSAGAEDAANRMEEYVGAHRS